MTLALFFLCLVIAFHVWFFVFEMFLWTKPIGRKLMGMTQTQADEMKILAMNQGLYNGMVASYLIWSLLRDDFKMISFILATIVIAGIFGAISSKKVVILFVQSLPAALAIGLIYFN